MAVITLTKDNFQQEVLDAQVPVLVDFFATWCGPCKIVGPILDEIAAELEPSGKAKICKVDVDQNKDLASQYGVMSIPTMLVFRNGEVVEQSLGAKPKEAILQLLG